MRKVKIYITAILLINSTFLFSQDGREAINVIQTFLNNKLTRSDTDKIYFDIERNDLLLNSINSSKLINELFKKEDLIFFKKQTLSENINLFDIQTDSIFYYNEKRDIIVVINNITQVLTRGKVCFISLPVFTKDETYAVFVSSYQGILGLNVYKKDNDKWGSYRSELIGM